MMIDIRCSQGDRPGGRPSGAAARPVERLACLYDQVHRMEEDEMLFMIIERFRNQNADAAYQRFREQGRLEPEGLTFGGSWVEANLDRCFQLMECDDASLIQRWVAQWSDLVSFEIVPVVAKGGDISETFFSQPH